jgi:hypothetical protein
MAGKGFKIFRRLCKMAAILAIAYTFSACYKDPNYPLRPKISFNDLQIREVTQIIGGIPITRTQISIAVNFTDGDGDLGLFPSDTTGPFRLFFVNGRDTTLNLNYYNIFPTVMVRNGNRFDTIRFPLTLRGFQIYGRFPPLFNRFEGPGEPLDGIIRYDINSTFRDIALGDTIKLMVFIKDRALNNSDTVITPEVIFR